MSHQSLALFPSFLILILPDLVEHCFPWHISQAWCQMKSPSQFLLWARGRRPGKAVPVLPHAQGPGIVLRAGKVAMKGMERTELATVLLSKCGRVNPALWPPHSPFITLSLAPLGCVHVRDKELYEHIGEFVYLPYLPLVWNLWLFKNILHFMTFLIIFWQFLNKFQITFPLKA
jgi:hypothetical protein